MLLEGKKILVFGALDENSLAWKVAEEVYRQGARVVLTNTPVAIRFGKVKELSEKLNAPLIPADATSLEDIEKLFEEIVKNLGKIDGVLHSVAMSFNIRKKREYPEVDYQLYVKTLDVSAISLHKILHVIWKKDVINEWGAVITLTYIASRRVFPKYNDMADAKALLESIVRNFSYWLGKEKKVRVLAVDQSPTWTTAGSSVPGFKEFYEISDRLSPLGNATGEDCARLCAVLFSDFARKVTGQVIHNDGGFSAIGIVPEIFIG